MGLKGDHKEGFDLALELPANDQDRIERGPTLCGTNFWCDNLLNKRLRFGKKSFHLRLNQLI